MTNMRQRNQSITHLNNTISNISPRERAKRTSLAAELCKTVLGNRPGLSGNIEKSPNVRVGADYKTLKNVTN